MIYSILTGRKGRTAGIQVNNDKQATKSRVRWGLSTGLTHAFVAAAGLLCVLAPHAALAASQTTFCTPYEVVVYTHTAPSAGTIPPRLHVQCTAPVGNISYFAVSSADPAEAARVLSVINTALVSGRTLTIRYDPADLTGAAIGCQNADCRLIQAIGFQK